MSNLNELREQAAALARRASEAITPYPVGVEIPQDVGDEARRLLAESKALGEQIRTAQSADTLRQEVNETYRLHWQGVGPRSLDPQSTPTAPEGFSHFGEFLSSIYAATKLGRRDRRLVVESAIPEFAKDLEEGTGSAGGFLVPEEYRATLLQKAGEGAIVRPRATIIPMARRQVNIPAIDYTISGTGKTAFFGGVRAYWTEESGRKEETEPAFRKIQLVAHKLAGYTPVEDELIEDAAITLAPLLTTLFGGAVRWHEDYAFLTGDGVAKPLGVLNAGVTIQVTRQGAGAFVYQDAVNMVAQLQPGANPIWVMAQSVMPQLFTLQDMNGNYIWVPAHGVAGAAAPAPGTLLGYPIYFTEKLPTLGTTGDVMLADFSYYLIGDRKALTIAYSTEYLFRYDETAWRFVQRVDGQPWLNVPVQLQDGTNISPFIILGAYGP